MKSLSPLLALVRNVSAPLVLLLVAMLVSTYANAASFAEGDQIKVTRAAPMFFRSEKYRDGNEGETFNVLAYRPELKKVFVLAKGKDGKDLALSIDETAVQLVPADPVAALAAAKTAMAAKRFADASAVIAAAMRTNLGDTSLSSALSAVKETEAASKAIGDAKATAGRTAADIIRIRKNARVIDHPSALFPDDTSNQTRAAALREQADALEQKAAASLREAEGKYAAASSAFNRLVDAASKPPADVKTGVKRIVPEATKKFFAEWEEDAKQTGTPPGVPLELAKAEKLENGEPGYEATIAFLNNRMRFAKVYFSEKRQKMVVSRSDRGVDFCVFDPAEMNPGIKYRTTQTRGTSFVPSRKVHTFTIETSGNKGGIEIFDGGEEPKRVAGFSLYAADEIELEKLAKAWRHLILLCGGKEDPF
jgi:hypothetical protein